MKPTLEAFISAMNKRESPRWRKNAIKTLIDWHDMSKDEAKRIVNDIEKHMILDYEVLYHKLYGTI
jgi:polyhydroxyalkanoate synthesis regulator phasin